MYQVWGRAWFVRAISDPNKILITFEKLVELDGLSRTGRSLNGKDELI